MPDWVMQIIMIFVFSGGLLGAVLLWRQDRRRAPIEWRTAALAEHSAVSKSAVDLVAITNERLREVHERLAEQDKKLEDQQSEISSIRRDNETLARHLTVWGWWYADLTEDWEDFRAKDAPPPAPELR